MNKHEKYIQRCIELAKNGLGTTYPNPMVGSVIVYNDTIIGEGWHQKAGQAHAEVNAIASVKDKSLLTKATIYVSLEPCSHFGKTPPCSDLIVNTKIPNVVIGTVDPNVKVAGNGIKKLVENGINVTVGVLEKECNELNKRFFTFHQKKRPFIILKWAQSRDGFLAPLQKEITAPVWLTSDHSRQLVHKWRTEEQAILVGAQTVLDDNPKLNARDWFGLQPTRVVIDPNNRVLTSNAVLNDQQKTIVFTRNQNLPNTENTTYVTIDFDQNSVAQMMQHLYEQELQSVIIEGGRHTLQAFIDCGIWDEARIFTSKTLVGNGIKAPSFPYFSSTEEQIATDQLVIVNNHDSIDSI